MGPEHLSPLIVLNALIIRAESTPPTGLRVARPRYSVNRAGQGIEEGGVSDRTLALTAQPQLEWEAFDEYWRKIHGPKILHSEGESDRITPLLVYYLQQHRVPSGPSSENPPPYSARLNSAGRLVPDPAAQVPPYRRPIWDGLALLAYRSKEDLATFFDLGPGKYGDKIVPDEAVFVRGFAFHVAEEHVVIQNGDRRRDPIIMVKTHTRNMGSTRADFRARWQTQHARLISGLTQAQGVIRRYAQLHNLSQPGDLLYDPVGDRFDGVTVMSFANMNELEDFLASPEYRRVESDEREFAAESRYFTAINYVIRDNA
jgi:hypothetical protein